jgi:hypothetical protein
MPHNNFPQNVPIAIHKHYFTESITYSVEKKKSSNKPGKKSTFSLHTSESFG